MKKKSINKERKELTTTEYIEILKAVALLGVSVEILKILEKRNEELKNGK